MTTKSKLSVLWATVAMSSAIVMAQEATKDAPSPFTVDADVKWVSEYWFRGYDFQDNGLILQPEVTVGYKAYSQGDLSITPYVNLWANVTDREYTDTNYFDELDITAGVVVTKGRFTFDTQYIIYTSPGGNWSDVHEIGESVSFDDAGLTPCPIGLNPYVSVYLETRNDTAEVASYAELGLKPKWTPAKTIPLTLQFPLAFGLGLNNKYTDRNGDNETLGFYSASIVATYNLTDHWYIGPGVKWIHALADSAKQSHHGDPDGFVVSATIGCSY